jgi:hypothetical protein
MNSNLSDTNFSTVLAMCQMMLKDQSVRSGRFLKTEDIQSVVVEVASMPTFHSVDQDRLVSALEERFTVVTPAHLTLGTDDGHKAWLPLRRGDIPWRYWDRYRLHLAERVPNSSVDSIDTVTNDILQRIEDPQRTGQWDRRGLVMGHVQSGKTANYTGLICKAADSGYKVIIVLAGIHNSLRSQTQIRLDEGFLGFMSETPGRGQQSFKRVGVGLIDSSIVANTGTNRTQLGDFSEKVAKQFGIHPGGLPLVFVVKKHVGVLNNLIRWIRSCADAHDEVTGRKFVRNVPALVIDDEADLASVDTRQQAFDEDGKPDENHDPAKTNRNIRLVLRAFEKVAYVGYTATPFANIYIHDKGSTSELGDDLFPRSFIVNIPAPSNYMGPARIFGISEDEHSGLKEIPSLPILRSVSDHAISSAVDETEGWMPPKLVKKTAHIPMHGVRRAVPPSLIEAIMSFLLTSVVRKLREKGPLFNSMLIHVARYTAVQKEVANQVLIAVKDIFQRLRNGDGNRSPTIFEEFEELWNRDFVPTSAACSQIFENKHLRLPEWRHIHPRLENVASGVRVKVINGSAGDILDYEEHRETGMDLIAVGGDKLSRGLTLEGLSVSYFLRASRMYDTLMQMGRWFGYRDKYIDVCRLYTTVELMEWFTHISAASEELQSEFEHMVSVDGTPKDYGLKVRSHPVMLVTSAVKMRNGTEMKLSFSGDVSETTVFKRESKWLQDNLHYTQAWLSSLGEGKGQKAGGYTWHTKTENILEFLTKFKTHEEARRADVGLLARYIKTQRDREELVDWTVRLASSDLSESTEISINGHSVGLIRRAPHPEEQRPDRYTIRRIVNPADESIDLTQEIKKAALDRTIENWEKSKNPRKSERTPTRPGGMESRELRDKTKGLLIIYPLDPKHAGLPHECPVIGIAISFPKSDTAKEITYTVNNVFTNLGGDDENL